MIPFSFLMCSERSGSNLIVSLLNGHPSVSGPPPTHLFRLFANNRFRYGDLTDDENWNALIEDFALNFERKLGVWNTSLGRAEFDVCGADRKLSLLLRFLYEQEAKHDGASHVFVKENHTARIVPFLLSSFPGCRFVWSVRDPRDVAASWLSTRSIPGGVERAVEVWLEDQRESRVLEQQLLDQSLVFRVTYEDVLSQPGANLSALTEFLNLPYDEVMLRAHEDERTRANADRIDGWSNLTKPLMRNNAGKFRDVLTESECEFVELRCQSMMETLGYRPEIAVNELSDNDRKDRIAALRPLLREGDYEIPSGAEREIRRLRLDAIDRVLSRRARS